MGASSDSVMPHHATKQIANSYQLSSELGWVGSRLQIVIFFSNSLSNAVESLHIFCTARL